MEFWYSERKIQSDEPKTETPVLLLYSRKLVGT